MAVRLGRYAEARQALEESVQLNTSIGDRWNLGFTYRGLGLIAQAQGEHLQAVDMFRKSLDTLTEVGARQDEARVLVEMSHSIFALENDAEAEPGCCEALQVTMETQGTFVALEALLGIATLKAKQGNIERAHELLLTVLNHPASLEETKWHTLCEQRSTLPLAICHLLMLLANSRFCPPGEGQHRMWVKPGKS